ncbi:transcriptional regulatory protein [Mycobacteroides abscessus subsp. massiliense]|uniref:helix-turn-helix domain-containing protein n=1 Tax=Mycobacteroides abscessus TaxID=36809 RepID=UPI0009A84AD7|nr:helix-turn-helix domain-containing protein [Mycobacteroides abscessus]MBE5502422.1 hypothetical protein [Mycobacteroides abscessus]SLH57978.1 transcriptional regulatory protein [Mycobacteroides abscessus subsp. massiliense]
MTSHGSMEPLGEFLCAARARAGLSRERLAATTGYSVAHLGQVETGRATPSERVLTSISSALSLTPFEQHYALLLSGRVAPTLEGAIASSGKYLQALSPHLAAAMDGQWTAQEYNTDFARVFKGIWLVPNLVHWMFAVVHARRIVLNWPDAVNWLLSSLRWSSAALPSDEKLRHLTTYLMAMSEFRDRWDKSVIPTDPATAKPWLMRDEERKCVLEVSMKIWARPGYQGSGLLLLGTVENVGQE